MDKAEISKILTKAAKKDVALLSKEVLNKYKPVVIKEPEKTLVMIKMREPVKQSLFYLGEIIACEAAVEIDGVAGMAVLMGEDSEKVLNMAIIDAAINKGIFSAFDKLKELEKQQNEEIMKENALHLETMVNFESLDRKAPSDVNSFEKT